MLNRKDAVFATGLVWNYISMIFMAAGGLCFSLLIGIFYDAETLGFFNTFYAAYMVFAQVASFGCQNAITKYVSEEPSDINRAKSYLLMALIIIGLISVVTNIVGRLFLFVAGDSFDFSIIEINAMLFGVFVFAVNKTILGFFNGLSRMTEYGIFQSCRYIFIALFIIVFSTWKLDREYLVLCFLCAETLLFVIELPSIVKSGFSGIKITKSELKEIAVFGYRILPSNLVLSLNSKADVLCLSLVTGDERLVGIYSFAALFVEGFYELFVVLRRSINPQITYNFVNNKFADYYEKTNDMIRRYGYVISALCGLLVVIVHRFACIFMKDSSYFEGTLPLIIIIIAVVINIKGVIWANLLSQVGNPKYETSVNLVTILFHLVLNLILIKLIGMIGVAMGAATSYFVLSTVQKLYIKKELKL